jgi:hypothetical protein
MALTAALAACAYRGYELMPEETTPWATERYTLVVQDLPMPIAEMEFTQWIYSAVPQDQSAVPQEPEPLQNMQERTTEPTAAQGTHPPQNQTASAPQATSSAADGGGARYHSGITILPPTIAQVNAFLDSHPSKYGVGYDENAALDAATRESALNSLNCMRFIAGVPANVTWDYGKTDMAEAAAVLLMINGELSHYPKRPAHYDEGKYQLGYTGASTSNIADVGALYRRDAINRSLRLFLADADSTDNLNNLGHRRWMLNPPMGKTAFGVMDSYCVMTATDTSNAQAGPSIVMFPGQVTPKSYFENNWCWSVSFSKEYNVRGAKVTVMRRGDGATYRFGQGGNDGLFSISSHAYGQPGCVIFRPGNISIQIGDIYDVQMTGITKNGQEWLVQYTVQFI